jgi:hypothetical protein
MTAHVAKKAPIANMRRSRDEEEVWMEWVIERNRFKECKPCVTKSGPTKSGRIMG